MEDLRSFSVSEVQPSRLQQPTRALEEVTLLSSPQDAKVGSKGRRQPLPWTSERRLNQAKTKRGEKEVLDSSLTIGLGKPSTVLYLAYGSNLCAETFQGARGIRPLSAVNVLVPEMEVVFDLAGIPYSEPCFANSRYRRENAGSKPTDTPTKLAIPLTNASGVEKGNTSPTAMKKGSPKFSNPEWHKGLVGVVYEVTETDYAHIIATEGGGASYADIEIDCYELPRSVKTVPDQPDGEPFKAHTLFADTKGKTGRRGRRDGWAQPSARYLKLITDGSSEHSFPEDYSRYLDNLQPYTITTTRQRLGQFILLSIWAPWIAFLFGLQKLFGDDKGRSPKWLVWLLDRVFAGVWLSYDIWFREIFGDGERTESRRDDGDMHQRKEAEQVV